MNKSLFARWRANFFTGLAVVLPAIVSIGALLWIFGTVATFTDKVLFFLPRTLTHTDRGTGEMYWYWSLAAFVLVVAAITVVGLLARNYLGRQLIEWVDTVLLRVPILNKIYGASKQINEAFTSGSKTAFRTVVLIEFPRPGIYSVGFITAEHHDEVYRKIKTPSVCVFIPTTPNPTSGFMMIVPESQIIKLDMSVADGLKYIVSLGAITPETTPPRG